MQKLKNLGTSNSIWTELKKSSITTYNQVVMNEDVTLGDLVSKSNEWRILTLSIVSVSIADFLNFVNKRNTMNSEQVAETAQLIVTEYPFLKLNDIVLFFRKCKIGEFGELFGEISGFTILSWMKIYNRNRKIAFNIALNQKLQAAKKL